MLNSETAGSRRRPALVAHASTCVDVIVGRCRDRAREVRFGGTIAELSGPAALGIEIQTREHLRHVEGGLDLLDVRSLAVSGLMMLIIRLRPRYEGQAKTALMAALSGPYMHPKVAIAVDEDIDASDLGQVMWSITTRVEASRDIVLIPNTRVFGLATSSWRTSCRLASVPAAGSGSGPAVGTDRNRALGRRLFRWKFRG